MPDDLEQLYQDAKSALKARDYNRAGGLLNQILLIDEDYRDASRLLAQSVKFKRRKWYNDRRLWAAAGTIVLMGIGFLLAPRVQELYAREIAPPPSRQTIAAPVPTSIEAAAPMAIPLTWSRISIGQEFARDLVAAFVIDPSDPEVLYVRMKNAGYFKSINGGVSWQPTRAADAPGIIQSALTAAEGRPGVQQGVGAYQGLGAVVTNLGPDGKKRLYQVVYDFSDESNWMTSGDGGTTWSLLGSIGKPPSRAIAFDDHGSTYVYCATHLCKYNLDGKQRTILGAPQVGPFSSITISPHDKNVVYVAGNGLSVSRDAGQTWAKLNNGLGGAVLQIETGSGNSPVLYVEAGQCSDDQRNDNAGQPLYLSGDAGKTWSLSLQTGCYLIKDADKATIYRVGRFLRETGNSTGWIWRSPDSGTSWENVLTPGSAQALVADPLRAGFLYASMEVGFQPWNTLQLREQAFYSQDFGLSWKRRGSTADLKRCSGSTPQFLDSNRPMAIDPRDGNHVFSVVSGMMMESDDSCAHDSHLFSNAPSGLINSIVFDPDHPATLYAGTDQGAYVSFNDGQTWDQINDGLLGVTVVYSIAVDHQSNVYAATPYGIFKLEGK